MAVADCHGLPVGVAVERYAENFLGMLYLGCCLILLRHI